MKTLRLINRVIFLVIVLYGAPTMAVDVDGSAHPCCTGGTMMAHGDAGENAPGCVTGHCAPCVSLFFPSPPITDVGHDDTAISHRDQGRLAGRTHDAPPPPPPRHA